MLERWSLDVRPVPGTGLARHNPPPHNLPPLAIRGLVAEARGFLSGGETLPTSGHLYVSDLVGDWISERELRTHSDVTLKLRGEPDAATMHLAQIPAHLASAFQFGVPTDWPERLWDLIERRESRVRGVTTATTTTTTTTMNNNQNQNHRTATGTPGVPAPAPAPAPAGPGPAPASTLMAASDPFETKKPADEMSPVTKSAMAHMRKRGRGVQRQLLDDGEEPEEKEEREEDRAGPSDRGRRTRGERDHTRKVRGGRVEKKKKRESEHEREGDTERPPRGGAGSSSRSSRSGAASGSVRTEGGREISGRAGREKGETGTRSPTKREGAGKIDKEKEKRAREKEREKRKKEKERERREKEEKERKAKEKEKKRKAKEKEKEKDRKARERDQEVRKEEILRMKQESARRAREAKAAKAQLAKASVEGLTEKGKRGTPSRPGKPPSRPGAKVDTDVTTRASPAKGARRAKSGSKPMSDKEDPDVDPLVVRGRSRSGRVLLQRDQDWWRRPLLLEGGVSRTALAAERLQRALEMTGAGKGGPVPTPRAGPATASPAPPPIAATRDNQLNPNANPNPESDPGLHPPTTAASKSPPGRRTLKRKVPVAVASAVTVAATGGVEMDVPSPAAAPRGGTVAGGRSDSWSQEERQQLQRAFMVGGDPTSARFWDDVASRLPGRSAAECRAAHAGSSPGVAKEVEKRTKRAKFGEDDAGEEREVANLANKPANVVRTEAGARAVRQDPRAQAAAARDFSRDQIWEARLADARQRGPAAVSEVEKRRREQMDKNKLIDRIMRNQAGRRGNSPGVGSSVPSRSSWSLPRGDTSAAILAGLGALDQDPGEADSADEADIYYSDFD